MKKLLFITTLLLVAISVIAPGVLSAPSFNVLNERNTLTQNFELEKEAIIEKYIKYDPNGNVIQDENYRKAMKEYESLQKKYQGRAINADNNRNNSFNEILQKSGVETPPIHTGTAPGDEEYRGIYGDQDVKAESVKDVNKIALEANKRGYTVKYGEGYIKIPELDIVVWDPGAIKLGDKGAVPKKLGLSELLARIHDPEFAPTADVGHQIKKASGDLQKPIPLDKSKQNEMIQNISKSVKKSGEITGATPEKMDIYKKLKAGSSPEGTVYPLGTKKEKISGYIHKFRDQAKEELSKSYSKVEESNQKVLQKLKDDQNRIEKQIQDTQAAGDKKKAATLQQNLAELDSRVKNFNQITKINEGIMWKKDPKLMYELTNNLKLEKVVGADGKEFYVDKTKKIEVTKDNINSAKDNFAKSLSAKPGHPATETSRPTRISKAAIGLSFVGEAISAYEAYETEKEAAIKEGRQMSIATVATNTVLNISGVNNAWMAGQELRYEAGAGTKEFIMRQLEKCKKAGYDPDSSMCKGIVLLTGVVRGTVMGTYAGAKGMPLIGDVIGGIENSIALAESTYGLIKDISTQWAIEEANMLQQAETLEQAFRSARSLAGHLSTLVKRAGDMMKTLARLEAERQKLEQTYPKLKEQRESDAAILLTLSKQLRQIAQITDKTDTARLLAQLDRVKKESANIVQGIENTFADYNKKALTPQGVRTRYSHLKQNFDSTEATYNHAFSQLKTLINAAQAPSLLQQLEVFRAQAEKNRTTLQSIANSATSLASTFEQLATAIDTTTKEAHDMRDRLARGIQYFKRHKQVKVGSAEWDELNTLGKKIWSYEIVDIKKISFYIQRAKFARGLSQSLTELSAIPLPPLDGLPLPVVVSEIAQKSEGQNLLTSAGEADQSIQTARKQIARLNALLQGLPKDTIAIDPSELTGEPNKKYTFTAKVTSPPAKARYEWNFGDGTPVKRTENNTVSHIYSKEGTFNITVRLYDTPTAGMFGDAKAKASIKGGIKDYKKPWWEDYKFYSGTLTITTTLQVVRKVTREDNKGRYMGSEEFKESVTCKSIGPVSIRLDRKSISGGFRITTGTYPAKYEITEGYKTESGYKCAPIEKATNEKDYLHSIFGWTLAEYSQGGMGVFRGNEGIAIKDGRFIYIGKEEYDKGERGMGGKGLSLIGEVTGDGQFKLWIKRPYGISGQKDVYYYIGEGRYDETRMSVSYSEGSGGQLSSFLLDKKSSFLLDLNRVVITKP